MRCILRDWKYGMLFHVSIQCTKLKYFGTTSVLKISHSKKLLHSISRKALSYNNVQYLEHCR